MKEKYKKHLHRSRGILGGQVVIRGTRLRPYIIHDLLDGGFTRNDILRVYTYLTDDQINSAIDWYVSRNGTHK
jgi:uncharacterized protein (DUF433 family)